MRDDVMLFLVASKRDLVVKISREFYMICTIFLLNSCEIFTTKSRFDVTRKTVTSCIRAIK